MLTLSFSDLERLSNGQREALSGFILSFSSRPAKRVEPSDDYELTPEDASPTPEQAFKSQSVEVTSNVDKLGLPWDERIHSSSKNFNADGTWRKKRGVADALVAEVEAQLKALMSVPAAEVVLTIPESQLTVPPPPPAPVAVMPSASPIPLPSDFDPKVGFVNFIKRSANMVKEKKITQEEVKEICIKHGVADIPLLGHRLDLVPTIAVEVEELMMSR